MELNKKIYYFGVFTGSLVVVILDVDLINWFKMAFLLIVLELFIVWYDKKFKNKIKKKKEVKVSKIR